MARVVLPGYGKKTRARARAMAMALGANGVVEKCTVPAPGRRVTLCMRKTGRPSAPIKGDKDVCRLMRNMGHGDRESFYVLHLDTRHRVDGIEEVSKGVLGGVEVHPRETFKSAILNNAAAIILLHNHPSGDASPSTDDMNLTERLVEGGKLLGIPVLDHVIVTDGGCGSLRNKHPHMFMGAARLFARKR